LIKSLALTNFKSIGKTLIADGEDITEGKLDFKPLTIFCGKNSSGKSTVLQSILLLAQTLQNSVPSQTFVLNGPMVKLGSVNDIKSEFADLKKKDEIVINMGFSFMKPVEQEIGNKFEAVEEKILIKSLSEHYKYFLSNSLNEIEKAINGKLDHFFKLDNEKWIIDPNIAPEIKELMNKNNVNYSVTFTSDYERDVINIAVYKWLNNEWFAMYLSVPYFDLIGSTTSLINSSIKNIKETSYQKNKQTLELSISFCNISPNDISDIIPLMKKLSLNIPERNNFTALYNDIKENDFAEGDIFSLRYNKENFHSFDFELDNTTKKALKEKVPVGLFLSHFLPEYFAYIRNSDMGNDIIKKYFYIKQIQKFVDEKYQFNNQSVKEFQSTIRGLLKLLSQSDRFIEETFKQIFAEQDIIINDNIIFVQYTKKCLSILESIGVKQLYDKYIHAVLNKVNDIFHLSKIEGGKLCPFLQWSVNEISKYFKNNVVYIGPLREEPYFHYVGYTDNIVKVNHKGENITAVLYHNKRIAIEYIKPNYDLQNFILDKCNLNEIVNEWLCYIGVAESISATFNGRYGYGLEICSSKENKKSDTLTNVGVGVSQVLPIILACLLASEETTIIIEQPELHLHPAMQTRLTDFFVATIFCNKQIILETHSEYIINRLRQKAIKWSTGKSINEDLKIYFTENLPDDLGEYKKGNTIFRPLEINENAAMSDWPKGFFDESSKIADEIITTVSEKWNENENN
jgi:predicted ATPase